MKSNVISKVISGGESWVALERGFLRVVGGDRVRFLNGQLTNDISKIPVGEVWYAAACQAKGKMISDLWIANRGDEFWIDTGVETIRSLKERLEKYLISDDVEISFLEGYRLWHRFGSNSHQVSDDEVMLRSKRFGLDGFDFWIREGKDISRSEVIDVEELKCLRILNFVPEWGRELGVDILPPEAGMNRNAIRYDKGCYVGQEVIAKIKSIGHVSKILVQLNSLDERVPAEGSKLVAGDKEVGWVTSSSLNPLTGRGIALGYISWAFSKNPADVYANDLALTILTENA